MAEIIHYEELLVKYIRHVERMEGENFIDYPREPNIWREQTNVEFSDAEWRELQILALKGE